VEIYSRLYYIIYPYKLYWFGDEPI
jgi:hypothetical protein